MKGREEHEKEEVARRFRFKLADPNLEFCPSSCSSPNYLCDVQAGRQAGRYFVLRTASLVPSRTELSRHKAKEQKWQAHQKFLQPLNTHINLEIWDLGLGRPGDLQQHCAVGPVKRPNETAQAPCIDLPRLTVDPSPRLEDLQVNLWFGMEKHTEHLKQTTQVGHAMPVWYIVLLKTIAVLEALTPRTTTCGR
ncbi:hypothetical protein SODALDRAFT_362196 [Sodiomyces alkalinus F11]|uniref:Uncharacterized protein n=1 Tax=Sodiomyces alkalinus (strain CBS 110278 / VKM F-3762 / F11) TaxID=1314773 RepID=A0A3N2PPV6_SODAK|nr:hypothetical protein SODALDRAFT_362196 [Sodiomyces alkalinus F11]ROT36396.1 hypothetical protein SODALDRAFT_362196 [Sodiomyces alkalinus F11]